MEVVSSTNVPGMIFHATDSWGLTRNATQVSMGVPSHAHWKPKMVELLITRYIIHVQKYVGLLPTTILEWTQFLF